MSKTENKPEFSNAEYLEKIREAEIELEKVRLAAIEYLEKFLDLNKLFKFSCCFFVIKDCFSLY